MYPDLSLVSHCNPSSSPISSATEDGSLMHVVYLSVDLPSSSPLLSIPDVFYVPRLSLTLFPLSVTQLSESSFDVQFSSSGCVMQDWKSKEQTGTRCRVGNLYVLKSHHIPMESASMALSSVSLKGNSPRYVWHSRLGRLSGERIKN